MSNEQTSLRMWSDCRQIIKKIVRMRQDDWPDPFLSIVITSIIDPDRPDGRVKRSFAAARKQPYPTITITCDAAKIVIGVRRASLSLLARSTCGSLGFRTIHWEICRAASRARTRKRFGKRSQWLNPFALFEHPEAHLPVTIKTDAFITHQCSPIFSPGRAAQLVTDPQPAIEIVRERRSCLVLLSIRRCPRIVRFFIRDLAHPNIVISFVIRIPRDSDPAGLRCGCDRRRPAIPFLRADHPLRAPTPRAILAPFQNSEHIPARALPCDPNSSV